MPRLNNTEESRLATLERLNPIAYLVPINEKMVSYLENFQGDSEHYTPQKAHEYRLLLASEIKKRKEKASRNKFALSATNSKSVQTVKAVKGKTNATKEVFAAIEPFAMQAGMAAGGPIGAIGAKLVVDKAHQRAQQAKKVVKGAVQILNEPKIVKTVTRVTAAAGAVATGGVVAGTLAPIMANTAQSLTQGAISASFSGITSNSGILSTVISPVVNATSSALGGVVGVTAGIVLPLALLYIAVPQLYKLFFWGLNKTVDAVAKNRNAFVDLSLLPDQGPLLELICNLSTLASIKKLDTELKLRGIANVKFNISNLFKKITNPDGEKLSQADEALYQLARKNSETLIKLSKKAAQDPKKLIHYQNLQITQELIKTIKEFIPIPTLSEEMRFCLSITGALISQEKAEIQEAFLHSLGQSLHDIANSDTSSLDSWTTDHTYESIASLQSERRYANIPSSKSNHTYENAPPVARHSHPHSKGARSQASTVASQRSSYTPLEHNTRSTPANPGFFRPASRHENMRSQADASSVASHSSYTPLRRS
ncbi:MAG: hypothetical protein V4471_01985 [Pseudomonadota bacterium]